MDFQNILQELKDTMHEEVVEQEKPKTAKTPKKKTSDLQVPLSSQDMSDLEAEFLGREAAYKEPNFEKQPIIDKPQTITMKNDNDSKILKVLHRLEKELERIDKKIQLNSDSEEANYIKIDENPQPIEIVKLMITQIDNPHSALYQLQTRHGVKEIALSEYYDMSRFVSMLWQYHNVMIIDKSISFENSLFNLYKDKLQIISQNILANSFRFFEKSHILDETIEMGDDIKSTYSFTAKAIGEVEALVVNMKEALLRSEYQKDYYFSALLNEKGFILNAVTIIDEMLGEYIVESAKSLSALAHTRITSYIDKIERTRSNRKAYYNLHKSAKEFFVSNYGSNEKSDITTFFPFKDSGNEEIKTQMSKRYRANKMNKSEYFKMYSGLIDRVRLIRNDLAHGNNARAYKDITAQINEVLIDFNYLAIEKNFLQD